MSRVQMAALAEIGLLGHEQLLVIGAMSVVAVEATLSNWCVLPQKGTALLGVALVALLIHRLGLDHLRRLRAVRVVATGATHLALTHWVMTGTEPLAADRGMAGETGL